MIARRGTLQFIGGALLAGVKANAAGADPVARTNLGNISIIGTGEVGSCLGRRWGALGYRVVYGSRTPTEARVLALATATGGGAKVLDVAGATAASQLILLAVPWRAVAELLPMLEALQDKVLIDITNPVKVIDGVFQVPEELTASIAEGLQARVAGSAVVKAFNTLSVEAMENSAVAGGAISVPIAGAAAPAKEKVAALAAAMGLAPIDVGPLYLARYLEDLARLRMTYKAKHRDAFECFFRLHGA